MKSKYKNTFLGVRQQHSYELHKLIDTILYDRNISKFLEIGTGNGAMSVLLGLHAFVRNGMLMTFDTIEREDLHKCMDLFDLLQIHMYFLDCFSDEANDLITNYMIGSPAFVFCDGGDKPKELETFSKHLPIGSIICAHDYMIEIFPDDIKPVVEKNQLKPLFEDLWGGKIKTCFFEKI